MDGRTITFPQASFRLELIIETELLQEAKIKPLLTEANELIAIMMAARNSAIADRHSAIH